MVLIATDAAVAMPDISVVNHRSRISHCGMVFRNVHVPVDALPGGGATGSCSRRRASGLGASTIARAPSARQELALALMSERAPERQAFGGRLADQSGAQEAIAKLRREIEQPRLPVLKAAWMIDEMGAKAARNEISMIEAVADRAMQIFGAMGLSPDMPLADT